MGNHSPWKIFCTGSHTDIQCHNKIRYTVFSVTFLRPVTADMSVTLRPLSWPRLKDSKSSRRLPGAAGMPNSRQVIMQQSWVPTITSPRCRPILYIIRNFLSLPCPPALPPEPAFCLQGRMRRQSSHCATHQVCWGSSLIRRARLDFYLEHGFSI